MRKLIGAGNGKFLEWIQAWGEMEKGEVLVKEHKALII